MLQSDCPSAPHPTSERLPGFGSGRVPPPPPLLRAANLGSLLREEGDARRGAEAGKGTQQTDEMDAAGGAMVLAFSFFFRCVLPWR